MKEGRARCGLNTEGDGIEIMELGNLRVQQRHLQDPIVQRLMQGGQQGILEEMLRRRKGVEDQPIKHTKDLIVESEDSWEDTTEEAEVEYFHKVAEPMVAQPLKPLPTKTLTREVTSEEIASSRDIQR